VRYLILSDIHSNLEALQSVMEAASGQYDKVVCCGDLVGYGPDPNAVVDWVRENATYIVRGNHDKACSGLTDADDFNEAARESAFWTRDCLTPENMHYLRNLPQGPQGVLAHFSILHGSPSDEDEYLHTLSQAAEEFLLLTQRVSFFGHTHHQGGFVRSGNRITEVPLQEVSEGVVVGMKTRGVLDIQAEESYLLNPGSVGQPRDLDNRAAFAIFDTEGWVEYRRVSYDVNTTMRKIFQAGLPESLGYRLQIGR